MALLLLWAVLVIVALSCIWFAVSIQRKWSVDGEVHDYAKYKQIQALLYAAGFIFIIGLVVLYERFNPPPAPIDGRNLQMRK